MDLFLIRHAAALDMPPQGGGDAARPLAAKGRRQLTRAVEHLERSGIDFDHLRTSPWLRAVESADLLSDLVHGELAVSRHLAEPPGQALLAELDGLARDGAQRVALVGHAPWLSELAAWLVLDDPHSACFWPLEKGGLAWLRGDPRPGGMRARALLPPRLMRGSALD
jgi:phosphohistidine phosphatase